MQSRNDDTYAQTGYFSADATEDIVGPKALSRRSLIKGAAAIGGVFGAGKLLGAQPVAEEPVAIQPIGQAKGIHPGRVVWVHDPHATAWKGPEEGRWYQGDRVKQDRVDEMMLRAVGDLTGDARIGTSWDKLFRHLNQSRGKGNVGYKPGEKILIKPNWVGMIWTEGAVNPQTYTFVKRQDYMNTAPQMIIALLRQLVGVVGVRESDISVCDTLAYLVHEYYDILHREFPRVEYADYAGQFGRTQVKPSSVPISWSCRPKGKAADVLPVGISEAEYLVNFANLKAHHHAGVTLCGKNHFGSLVRWPVQQGYYDLHGGAFNQKPKSYREQVDLMGHAHLGGKTVLYLVDGLFSGVHPLDLVPQKFKSSPFDGDWTKSLLASQDPVAIDSVAFDFLRTEFSNYPRRPGVDDYLHEAAAADNPPSGTFYDPDHATPQRRLASLGVHEHWNNPQEKKYSRNLGKGDGIELISVQR